MDTSKIIELFNAGMSQKQISIAANCSISTVRRVMKHAGVKGRSNGITKSTINHTYFDIIDTEHKAYWLGFLLADGCIAKSAGSHRIVRLSLQERDFGHLEKLAAQIGFKNKYYNDDRDHDHAGSLLIAPSPSGHLPLITSRA